MSIISTLGAHLLPEAEARDECRLEAARCSAWLGVVCWQYNTRLNANLVQQVQKPSSVEQFDRFVVCEFIRIRAIAAGSNESASVGSLVQHRTETGPSPRIPQQCSYSVSPG